MAASETIVNADGVTLETLPLNRWVLAFLWPVILSGLATRAISYAANRSLWLDEAMLSKNICRLDYAGLLRPLDEGQAAPFGYLLLVKLVTKWAGNSEYSLRAVSLACSIGVLPLAFLFVRRLIDAPTAVMTTAIVAVMPSQIYYAAEVKQYAMDTFVASVLLLLGVEYFYRPGADCRAGRCRLRRGLVLAPRRLCDGVHQSVDSSRPRQK